MKKKIGGQQEKKEKKNRYKFEQNPPRPTQDPFMARCGAQGPQMKAKEEGQKYTTEITGTHSYGEKKKKKKKKKQKTYNWKNDKVIHET